MIITLTDSFCTLHFRTPDPHIIYLISAPTTCPRETRRQDGGRGRGWGNVAHKHQLVDYIHGENRVAAHMDESDLGLGIRGSGVCWMRVGWSVLVHNALVPGIDVDGGW